MQISMRAAGQLLIALVLVYAVAAAGYSFFLLQKIESNADYAQENQLPLVLAQNRNALKIERLASLVRSAYLARDRELERQVQLQTHVLARSFTLDNNAQLADKVLEVAEQVKRIIAKREQIRRSETLAQTKTEGISAAQLDKQALEAYQSAMHLTDSLTQDLTTDAAALAYAMSGDIQKTARMIQLAWIVILILPVAIAIGALFVVARHIIAPIHTAINYLGSIDRQEAGDVKFRHPLFRELSTIFDAIQAYGRVSRDLLETNTILHTLSEEDGLTRLANRRSFERKLVEAFNTSVERGDDLAIVMVDLDHFKSINDRYGHQAGDTLEDGVCVAEAIRTAISSLRIKAPQDDIIRMTASLGVASMRSGVFDSSEQILENADKALYRAKHSGRNNVKAIAGHDIAVPIKEGAETYRLSLQLKVLFIRGQCDESALKVTKASTTCLANADLSPERLTAVDLGSPYPTASNDTDIGKALERPIEFSVK
eukprot:gene11194-13718_t